MLCLLSLLICALIGSVAVLNVTANDSAGERLNYAGIKYRVSQSAPISPNFNDSRKGLKLFAYDSGATAIIKGGFSGRFEAEVKASSEGKARPDLSAYTFIFQSLTTDDKFSFTVEDYGTYVMSYVSVGEDKTGVHYNVDASNDGQMRGYTTIHNSVGIYTKVLNSGITKVSFNPETMSVCVKDAKGLDVEVWSLTKEIIDGKRFAHVLSPMQQYSVSIEFTKITANKVGELIIYSINGEDFSNATLPSAKPLLYVDQTSNAIVGGEYLLPTPNVYDYDGKVSAKDVEYVVYDKNENVLSQGTYGNGATFTPAEIGTYYVWYKVTNKDGEFDEEYFKVKAYSPENVTVKYQEIDFSEKEYGLNSSVYIPERTAWSNVLIDGHLEQMGVRITKDGNELCKKDIGGFEYKFTQVGNYEICYFAEIGNQIYEDTINLVISNDVVGVVVEKMRTSYYYGEKIDIPSATIYLNGQSSKATATVIDSVGERRTESSIVLDHIGKYVVEYAYSIGGQSGVVSYSFNVEYRITDLFYSEGKGSYEYDETSGYAEAGVMFTVNDASAILSYDVDLSANTKDDVLIDFYVLSNEIGVSDIGGIYITLTDKLDPSNYVTVRCVDGSKNMDNGTYIKGRAFNQTAWTGYYKAPVFTSSPFDWSEKIEAAMAHNAGGFVNGHDFGPGITTQDFKDQSIRLCYDASEKAIYANPRYELKTTETQRERLVVDFDDSALFTSLWGGFTDDSQVQLSVSAFNLSATGKIKIVEVDGYKFSSESVDDVKAPIINLDMEGMPQAPDAKTGTPYNVFKTINSDNFCEPESLIEEVTVTYGGEKVEVVDGAFIPHVDGFYTITYEVSDAYGNKSVKRIEVESRSDITPVSLILEEDWAETAKYGGAIYYPKTKPEGGTGRYLYTKTVLCNGEKADSFEEYFIPLKSGDYEIIISVQDYIGQTATVRKEYSIEYSADIVVDESMIVMPPVFIDGNTYVFDKYVVRYYPAEGAESVSVTAKIEVTDANGTNLLGEDRKYTPKASDSINQATVRFIFEGKTKTIVEKKAEIRTIAQKSGFVTNYFLTENATIKAKNQFIEFEAPKAGVDLFATFIRPVCVEEFSIQFKMNELNGVSRSNFKTLELLLTDKNDPNIQVKFIIAKNGNGLSFSINGNTAGYMPGSLTTASTQNVIVAYNNITHAVTSADNIGLGVVLTNLLGKEFNGFTSNEAFVSFRLTGVTKDCAINLVSINNQKLFSSVKDTAQPQIFVDGSYSGMFTVATEITLPTARAYDVLNYTSEATITVRTPSGNYLTSVDGVLLKGAPANREYVIAPTELGRYTVAYASKDLAGQSKENAKDIVIYDNIPPEITLNEKLPEVVYVGTEVSIPSYTVTDNGNEKGIKVDIYYRAADGIMYHVEGGKIFVSEAGTYTICFYLVDENENYNVVSYEFIAVNK